MLDLKAVMSVTATPDLDALAKIWLVRRVAPGCNGIEVTRTKDTACVS